MTRPWARMSRLLLVAGGTLALACLAAGCGGFSYVYRSPVDRPLDGVARLGVRLEAQAPRRDESLARLLGEQEGALVAWLVQERRAASIAPLAGGEDATVHVLLTVAPLAERPDPREVHHGSLQIAVRITVLRGSERVAVVEGTASAETITFHGLVDPDLARVLERVAHRISRILEDLGVPRR